MFETQTEVMLHKQDAVFFYSNFGHMFISFHLLKCIHKMMHNLIKNLLS